MRPRVAGFLVILAAAALSACTGMDPGGLFRSSLSTQPGVVDSREAASLISAYRRQQGLGGVTVNPTLTRIAADHSRRMAAANRMAHVLPGQGSFRQKLNSGGYYGSTAGENVAAGQDSLAEVLAAWRRSPGHNRNLLLGGATEIGIAVAVAPESRYKTFWTLILGSPRQVGAIAVMPGSGPFVPAAVGGVSLEAN
ncbi:MAG: CAP domain-containing protein [Dongiaceae bacterium]